MVAYLEYSPLSYLYGSRNHISICSLVPTLKVIHHGNFTYNNIINWLPIKGSLNQKSKIRIDFNLKHDNIDTLRLPNISYLAL